MPNWTKEQLLAITTSGKNIIVSAGAGSGKTAVLTERVIQKLKNGESVDKLLILTFTNAAAKEMKDRIRHAIMENNLVSELDKIDSSYITTFDSFSLSVVKKYHYLLNINSNVKIADSLILKHELENILDNIFANLYDDNNPLFLKLIKDFTIRDDKSIKNYLLTMYNKISLKYDMQEYLDNYFSNNYDDIYLDKRIEEYESILKSNISKIEEKLNTLSLMVDGDFYNLFLETLTPLLNSNTYDDIKNSLDISLPRLKKGMDVVKPLKEDITSLITNLKKLTVYESRLYLKTSILNTKDYVLVLINIIKELDKKYQEYKSKNNLYDFLDISKMAISVVKENKKVQEELTNSFHEILVDEYQDTSDLQELFISLISNNNVYMVGDIKQSIYRFRNANPNLFKEKYVSYQEGVKGIKIDLVKNFRSREETLDNINYVFNYIMDLDLGGANYKETHQMVFGNTLYSEYKEPNQDNNFELLNYEPTKEYTKDEVEAFIVLNDIITKINNNYQVYDKKLKSLRTVKNDDFVILIDKSTSFSLYKKIFEYKKIPLTILKDEDISDTDDLYILKNILVSLANFTNKTSTSFKYAYLSLGRSYLFNLEDKVLYQDLKTNTYQDIIISKLTKLYKILDYTPIPDLIDKILEEFNFLEKLITISNINESIIRFDYLKNLSLDLNDLGYTYQDFLIYLEKMIENKESIKYSLNKEINNSVKIMTIHKSKGLEFPICYYTGLTNKFNTRDLKERFIYDDTLGFITPILYDNRFLNTILHTLYKNNYLKEDISERIRLLYVAMTRAKEKMILITSLKEDEVDNNDLVDIDIRLKYNSFASILNSISDKLLKFTKNIDLNTLNLTKDYLVFNTNNLFSGINKTKETINVSELNLDYQELKKERYSKTNHELITKEMKEKLEFGSYLHYLLEITDFKKKDLTNIPINYQKYFKKLFESKLLEDLTNTTIYKEYEFIYNNNHGIIDLMIEHDTYIDIIDYKLKNIDDINYHEQLLGYKEYIKTKTKKDINIYLYAIITGEYEHLK